MADTADTASASADAAFETLARDILDDTLLRHPELASMLGVHSHDDRLTDRRLEALDDERQALSRHLAALDAVDGSALSPDNRVDAGILRTRLEARAYDLDELREHEWNPMLANPGGAIYTLLARDFAPLGDRLRAVAGRLAAVPEALEVARRTLGAMPRVHLETALAQFSGTAALIVGELDRALGQEPALRAEIEAVRPAALEALERHNTWLADRLDAIDRGDPERDPRLGPERFTRKLGLTLDAAISADEVLARAEAELPRVEAELAETASRISGEKPDTPGLVRRVLDRLAIERPDNYTIVHMARHALTEATDFVEGNRLVTLFDDPVEIIVMPEIHRGVAVAYCDPPGPLESATLPTFFAISPTPDDWRPERVDSFFREYNVHMLRNLTVHEAMPGHVVQLSHARRFAAPTQVRAAFWSGPFVEGWAVYAERLMAEAGFCSRAAGGTAARRSGGFWAYDSGDALRMQQLKAQLRTIINAILDARVHTRGMSRDEAMSLMTERGFQEEGEAAGKWRRALLTSAQLSTYFVGYVEVSELVAALFDARPGWSERRVHDEVLAHGSPAPRHLRTLLGV